MTKRKVLWPIFSFLIFISIVLTLFSFLVTKSTFVIRQAEQLFKNIIESNFNVKVKIAEVEGNILTGYTFNDITIFADDSINVASFEFISVEYNLFTLFKRQKKIERILINEPSFDFSKISPQMLIKKKEEVVEKVKEKKEKVSVIAIKDVSIIRSQLALKFNNKSFIIKDINMEGKIYISSVKTTIFLEKCNAKIPNITDIKSLSGTIAFKNGFISLLDCSLKTSNSSVFFNGKLFDENKGLSLNMKNVSLEEISKFFLGKEECIRGKLKGRLDLKGKGENLELDGDFTIIDINYKDDSLGNIFCNLNLKKKNLVIKHLLWKPSRGEVSISGHYNLTDKKFSIETKVNELVLDNILSKLIKKDLTGKFTGEIAAKGSNIGDSAKREIEIKAHLTNSFVKNLSIDSLNADISFNNRIINLKEMNLFREANWIKIKGVWGKEKKLYAKSSHFYISPLLELLGINDVMGNLSMEGYYEETGDKRIIQARIECDKPGFKNIKATHLIATVNYNITGENSYLLIKDIDLLNNHLDSLSVSIISDSIIKSFSFFSEGKDLHLYSVGNLTRKNGNLFFLIDTLNLRIKKAEIINKEKLEIEVTKTGIKLKDGQLFLTDIPIVITLEIDRMMDYQVKMRSENLDLRTISELLKFNKNVGGTLDFEITGKGKLRNPRLTLNINAQNFFLEKMSADEILGSFNYFNDEIHITSLKIFKGDGISEASGIIPLTIFRKKKDWSRRIEFTIKANDLGDWIFYPFDRFCHYEGGKVYGTIRGNGTVGKIDMRGDLRLYSTNLFIPFLGIRLKNTEGYFQLSREEIEVKNLRATVGDGYLDIKGKLSLAGIKPESIDLSISGKHIPIRGFKDVYITVSPRMQMQGPLVMPILLGYIKIEKGDITIPFRRKRQEDIRGGNVSYDLEISAEEGNIWLTNEDANVELEGKIFAKGTGNVPQLSGSFETKRGFFFYLDHTFTIERGVFKFTNSPELNPEINLRAMTRIQYNDSKERDTTTIVYLNVDGTMQEPEFSLTSSDPSLTEANIILLLTLNVKSLEGIKSLENVNRLSEKAVGYWIRQTLLREFQKTFYVDAIDLETRLLGSQKTAKLTVGKYISNNLYLGVTHDIFASSKDEFEIEYKVWKGSYIIGKRNEEGRYNLGVRFKFKY